jgi:hypothetical protein
MDKFKPVSIDQLYLLATSIEDLIPGIILVSSNGPWLRSWLFEETFGEGINLMLC